MHQLHDPTIERDACGVGFVADVVGRPSREIVDLRPRGARTRLPPGSAARRRRQRRRRRRAAAARAEPRAGAVVRARDGLPARRRRPVGRRGGLPRRGDRAPRLAPCPCRPFRARRVGPREHAAHRAARARPAAGAARRRSRAARASRAPPRRARRRRLHRVALVSHRHVQGALRGGPARVVLSRAPATRARRAVRDLPPALLDEHRSDLGARAAVPPALPQRRDQRDRGERGSDARAPRQARDRRRGAGRALRRDGLRLGAARQRVRAARARRPRRAARARDADSAGVAARRAARRARPRLPPLPRDARRAVGRPGRRRSSPTGASSAPRSTGTGCGRCATRCRTTGLVACASEAGAVPLRGGMRRGKLGPGQLLAVDPVRRAARSTTRSRRASPLHARIDDCSAPSDLSPRDGPPSRTAATCCDGRSPPGSRGRSSPSSFAPRPRTPTSRCRRWATTRLSPRSPGVRGPCSRTSASASRR